MTSFIYTRGKTSPYLSLLTQLSGEACSEIINLIGVVAFNSLKICWNFRDWKTLFTTIIIFMFFS